MSKFKVGDIVVNNDSLNPYCVTTKKNHWCGEVIEVLDGGRFRAKTISCDYMENIGEDFGLQEEYFELSGVSTIKTTELKINNNEITITAKPFKITTDMLDVNELYKREVLGIWEKENPMIKKEGNEMIESLNLIDLYEKNKIEKLKSKYDGAVKEIREKHSLENKMSEIIKGAEEKLKDLYFSQFTDEQKELFSKGDYFSQDGFSLVKRDEIRLITDGSLIVNRSFENKDILDLQNELTKQIEKVFENTKIVRAHIGIAKTKEEVEDILTNYGILKKGKLVID